MKSLSFISIAAIAAASFFSSCGEKQQPSERVQVYATDTINALASDHDFVIPFESKGRNMQVKVTINGEPFNILWDTGAEMTCISSLELISLIKAGKINPDTDLIGRESITVADGSSSYVDTYYIRHIGLMGSNGETLSIPDVKVFVSPNMSAPLLLGQDVLRRFGRFTVDYNENVIELKQQ